MQYKLQNGKSIRIDDEELNRIQVGLKVDRDEAIQIWLEDNEYEVNQEQEKLQEVAKDVKIKMGARADKPKSPKAREIKPDEPKIALIKLLAKCLGEYYDNVQITNPSKLIEFNIGTEHFTLNLIRNRKPK